MASPSSGVVAFQLQTVVAPFKPVECIEVYNDTILAGLGDGTLISFVQPSRSTTAHDAPPWEVAQVIKGFGKRYIRQLQVIKQGLGRHARLLSLCEEGVNVHRLPEFTLQCQADRTRLATGFAWDAATSMLAVALKRRVSLFHVDGNQLVALRDFALLDAPTLVAWCGSHICVATGKNEYSLLHVDTGTVSELFSAGRATPCMMSLGSTQGLLLTRDNVGVFLGEDGRPSRRTALPWSQPPTALALSPPYCLGCLEQYVEVRSVHHTAAAAVAPVQLVPLAGMNRAAPSTLSHGGVVVAAWGGSGGIHVMVPVSYENQAAAVAAAGDYAQALALCALIPNTQARQALEDQLHVRYALELSAAGELDQAMTQLSMASKASPVTLLRLVPWVVPARLLQGLPCPYETLTAAYGSRQQAPPTQEGRVSALGTLLPYLMSHRSRLLGAVQDVKRSKDTQDVQQATDREGAAEDTSQGAPVQKGPVQGAPVESTPSQQQGDQVESTPSQHGDQVESTPSQHGDQVESTPSQHGDQVESTPSPHAYLDQLQPKQLQQLQCVVDTAIVKAMLPLPDTGALLRFCYTPDIAVDLQEAKASLEASGRYSELVALLQHRGRHQEALALLQLLSRAPQRLQVAPSGAARDLRGMPGVWAAVRYVVGCAAGVVPRGVIDAHAPWILAADPEAGLEMFLQTKPPMLPSEVLPVLSASAPALRIPYLEAALRMGLAQHDQYDTQLALSYLQILLHEHGGADSPGGQAARSGQHDGQRNGQRDGEQAVDVGQEGRQEGVDGDAAAQALAHNSTTHAAIPTAQEARLRLQELLLESSHIDTQTLLRKLPVDALLDIRALLLERQAHHTDVLRIYIHQLHNIELAESYCDRVYARGMSPPLGDKGGVGDKGGKRMGGTNVGSGWGGGGGGGGMGVMGKETPSGIYMQLIEVLLDEARGRHEGATPPHDDPVWTQIIGMLQRKQQRVPAAGPLHVLPGALSLQHALPFLRGALKVCQERRRSMAVVRNLWRGDHLHANEALVRAQQRRLVVDAERACSVCHKRLGHSVVVAMPNGQLQHCTCYQRNV